MPKITSSQLLKILKEYSIVTIGLMLYAFSWVSIIIPADGVGGGASGLALLIYYATGGANGGLSVGIGFMVINGVLMIIAAFTIGLRFGAKTIYSIIVISILMSFFQSIIPDNMLGLADDKFLSAVLGGALAGGGVSLCLMQGGSTGGSDIVAFIIMKYHRVSYGRVVMVCDLIIIGASLFIFKSIPTLIYGYIMVITFGYTADAVLAGNKQSSQIMIMSDNYVRIADIITNKLHRGVTILDGTGWYTKKPVKVVMVVCRKTEANVLLKHIKEADPNAFVSMGSVMGVYGKGFDQLKK